MMKAPITVKSRLEYTVQNLGRNGHTSRPLFRLVNHQASPKLSPEIETSLKRRKGPQAGMARGTSNHSLPVVIQDLKISEPILHRSRTCEHTRILEQQEDKPESRYLPFNSPGKKKVTEADRFNLIPPKPSVMESNEDSWSQAEDTDIPSSETEATPVPCSECIYPRENSKSVSQRPLARFQIASDSAERAKQKKQEKREKRESLPPDFSVNHQQSSNRQLSAPELRQNMLTERKSVEWVPITHEDTSAPMEYMRLPTASQVRPEVELGFEFLKENSIDDIIGSRKPSMWTFEESEAEESLFEEEDLKDKSSTGENDEPVGMLRGQGQTR